jgi:hypothetical protein
MDIERARKVVEERLALGKCVQCCAPLNRKEHELFWCWACRDVPRCLACGTSIDKEEAYCPEHQPREVLL